MCFISVVKRAVYSLLCSYQNFVIALHLVHRLACLRSCVGFTVCGLTPPPHQHYFPPECFLPGRQTQLIAGCSTAWSTLHTERTKKLVETQTEEIRMYVFT